MTKLQSFALLSLLLGQVGCNHTPDGQVPVFPVEGQVLYKGEPVVDALVVLYKQGSLSKEDASIPRPTGRTNSQGKFNLHTYTGEDGAPVGSYQVAISASPSSPDRTDILKRAASKQPIKRTTNILQTRFADPATSTLTVEIKAESNMLDPFKLQ